MQRTSFVHNQRWIAALAFAVLAFTGFSCGSPPPRAGEQLPVNAAAPAGDAGTAAPTNWTTYRSASGLEIPYPAGWYVAERESGQRVELYEQAPPENSDMPARVWMERIDETVDAFIAQIDQIESDTEEVHSNIRMRKVMRRDDRSDDDGLAVSYLWVSGGQLYRIGGRENDAALDYIVDHVEVGR